MSYRSDKTKLEAPPEFFICLLDRYGTICCSSYRRELSATCKSVHHLFPDYPTRKICAMQNRRDTSMSASMYGRRCETSRSPTSMSMYSIEITNLRMRVTKQFFPLTIIKVFFRKTIVLIINNNRYYIKYRNTSY